jgi:hypothetical protein
MEDDLGDARKYESISSEHGGTLNMLVVQPVVFETEGNRPRIHQVVQVDVHRREGVGADERVVRAAKEERTDAILAGRVQMLSQCP